jgi:hypothetical protein
MPLDAVAWLAAASVLLLGALLGLLTRRDRLWLPLVSLAAGLLGILVGVGWHVGRSGVPIAEALALLAGGALVVAAWAAPRWAGAPNASAHERSVALAGTLFGAAILVFVAAALSWRGTPRAVTLSARTWLEGVGVALASIGLGGWLPVFTGSAWGLWLAGRRGEFPMAATDRGRAAALFSYPWLTAALLVTLLWNLTARATILVLQPGDLWPLVVWLLGATYLHATSSWRPRRVAAWLATALAVLALIAALLAALSAGTVT